MICAPWSIRCALVVKTSKSLNLGFEKNRGPLRSPLPQPNTHTSFLRLALNAILFIFYSETLDKCQAAFLWAHVKVSSVSACKMLPRVSASSKNLVPSYENKINGSIMNSFDLCWTNKIQCQTGHMTYFWPMTNFLCIYLWSRIHIYIIQDLSPHQKVVKSAPFFTIK